MNEMKLVFKSKLVNEVFARTSVVAFLAPLHLGMEMLMEIKTIVAEAVVNAMIHGYGGDEDGDIYLEVCCDEEIVILDIYDQGCGIEDSDLAMQPLYTSREDLERSGMGFTIMQTFMTSFCVTSEPGKGTSVRMSKRFGAGTAKSQGGLADAQ